MSTCNGTTGLDNAPVIITKNQMYSQEVCAGAETNSGTMIKYKQQDLTKVCLNAENEVSDPGEREPSCNQDLMSQVELFEKSATFSEYLIKEKPGGPSGLSESNATVGSQRVELQVDLFNKAGTYEEYLLMEKLSCTNGRKDNNKFDERVDERLCEQGQKDNIELYDKVGMERQCANSKKENDGTHTVDKRLKCLKCGESFTGKYGLNEHDTVHAGAKEYLCKVCSSKFTLSSHLIRQESLHKDKDPYTCKLCDRTVPLITELKDHYITEHGVDPSSVDSLNLQEKRTNTYTRGSHLCNVCGKMLASKDSLRQHTYTHTGEFPLHCNICGKGFRNSCSLQNHKLIHADDRKYPCSYCGKRFTTKYTLQIHTYVHIGHPNAFPCVICGRVFSSNINLRQHLLIHQGIKPFKCEICGKHFRTKTNLRNHGLLHKRGSTC